MPDPWPLIRPLAWAFILTGLVLFVALYLPVTRALRNWGLRPLSRPVPSGPAAGPSGQVSRVEKKCAAHP